ncbi:hypothetical protein SDJN02_27464, partial [Cucurbita argyrosperma subsp. argyrosperma]
MNLNWLNVEKVRSLPILDLVCFLNLLAASSLVLFLVFISKKSASLSCFCNNAALLALSSASSICNKTHFSFISLKLFSSIPLSPSFHTPFPGNRRENSLKRTGKCGGFSPDASADLENSTVVGSFDQGLGPCEFVVLEFEPVELIGDVGVGEFWAESGLDAVQGRRVESGLRIAGGVRGSGDLEVAIQEIEFIFLGEMG